MNIHYTYVYIYICSLLIVTESVQHKVKMFTIKQSFSKKKNEYVSLLYIKDCVKLISYLRFHII